MQAANKILGTIQKPLHSSFRQRYFSALTGVQRENALKNLFKPGLFSWKQVEGRDGIQKTFQFTDFSQAWSFMSRSALLAEKMDHHPEWFNVYNMVEVTLTTHDCDGLSTKDIALAEKMDEFAADLLPTHQPGSGTTEGAPLSEVKVETTKA